jgi:sulfopyruvate decarboxylase TPP-binding subunit
MSHRGAEGEKIAAQIPMGQLTLNLLDLVEIPTFVIDSSEKIKEITYAVNVSNQSNKSIGIVLEKKLWSV